MCRTVKDGRAPGAIDRLPGEKWADFDARQRAHRIANFEGPISDISGYVRAADREDAKAEVRKLHPLATFYR